MKEKTVNESVASVVMKGIFIFILQNIAFAVSGALAWLIFVPESFLGFLLFVAIIVVIWGIFHGISLSLFKIPLVPTSKQ